MISSPWYIEEMRIRRQLDSIHLKTPIEDDLCGCGYEGEARTLRNSSWLEEVSSMESLIENCKNLLQLFEGIDDDWFHKKYVTGVLDASIGALECLMGEGVDLTPTLKSAYNLLNCYYPERRRLGGNWFDYRSPDLEELHEFFDKELRFLARISKAKSLLEIELLSRDMYDDHDQADLLNSTDWFDEVNSMSKLIGKAERVLRFIRPLREDYEVENLEGIISELKYANQDGVDITPWVRSVDYIGFMEPTIHGFPDDHQIGIIIIVNIITLVKEGKDPTKYLRNLGWEKDPIYKKILEKSVKGEGRA